MLSPESRKLWERFIEIAAGENSLIGFTQSSLKSHLEAIELKQIYGLDPLAEEFVPAVEFPVFDYLQTPLSQPQFPAPGSNQHRPPQPGPPSIPPRMPPMPPMPPLHPLMNPYLHVNNNNLSMMLFR